MRRASPPSYGAFVGYAKRKVEHLVAAEENKHIFIAPGEGTHLPVLDIIHKITPDRSDGSLTVEEWGLPPEMMIPPHTHAREDECNFVMRGELTCDVGGLRSCSPRPTLTSSSHAMCPMSCATLALSPSGSWRS